MRDAVVRAARFGVAVGAHPSYPDRADFGRRSMDLDPAELTAELGRQLAALREAGRRHPLRQAARRALQPDRDGCRAGRRGRRRRRRALGRARPAAAGAGPRRRDRRRRGRARACRSCTEAFLDRGYRPDGSLVPRDEPGALLDDPEVVAERALLLVRRGRRRRRSTARRVEVRRGLALRPRRLARRGRDGPRRARRAGRPRHRGARAVVTVRVLPMGDRAILLEVAVARRRARAARGARGVAPAGRRRHRARRADRPRARRPARAVARRGARLGAGRRGRRAGAAPPRPVAEVVLDIVYDGADLAETAELLGLSPAALAERHAAAALVGRVHRVRARVRLPRQPRLAVRRAAPRVAAHPRARRGGRASPPGSPAPIRARPPAAGG